MSRAASRGDDTLAVDTGRSAVDHQQAEVVSVALEAGGKSEPEQVVKEVDDQLQSDKLAEVI